MFLGFLPSEEASNLDNIKINGGTLQNPHFVKHNSPENTPLRSLWNEHPGVSTGLHQSFWWRLGGGQLRSKHMFLGFLPSEEA